MYSESDIEGAVASGAMTSDAARALREHVASLRATPAADEESFRLLTGFNDIFVSIAIILTLVAVGWIGLSLSGPDSYSALSPLVGAAVSWGLAEYFTRRRRMALPSIILLLSFVSNVATTFIVFAVVAAPDASDTVGALLGAGVALLTAGAAWLHWQRFMVPITVAAGAVALAVVAIALVMAIFPAMEDAAYPIAFATGLIIFGFAMWWDMSDKERRTRRSDVAFWLHLAAAPLIAHPVFQMLGVFDGEIDVAKAVVVVALYVAFAFVALAVDRRALLVSSLAYVLYALYALFRSVGAVELGGALTALIIGSALLTLSAFWQPMRRLAVGTLGGIADQLPPVQPAVSPRPA